MPDDVGYTSYSFRCRYAERVLELADLLSKQVFLYEYASSLSAIVQSMEQPFKMAVFGYMKSGKSSIINSLLGRCLAAVGINETTATVNHISYGFGASCDEFIVHQKNDAPRSNELSQIGKWVGNSKELEEKIKYVKHLQFFADSPFLRKLTIIDTPGIGSVMDFHDDVAKQFLHSDNTDAMLYVLKPGATDNDRNALQLFREQGKQGYGPYNCMGVLHLWDEIYWNTTSDADVDVVLRSLQNDASEFKNTFSAYLKDVVPVSAPLGLLASCMSDTFWQQVVDCLHSYGSLQELRSALRRSERYWKSSEPELYALWDLTQNELNCSMTDEQVIPLVSFRTCLHYLYSQQPLNGEQAKDIIREFSGIPELLKAVDDQFLQSAAVINLRRIRNQVQTILRNVYFSLERKRQKVSGELTLFQKLQSEVTSSALRAECDSSCASLQLELSDLREATMAIDRCRIEIAEDVELMDNAHYLLFGWEDKQRWLTTEMVKQLDACAQFVWESESSLPVYYYSEESGYTKEVNLEDLLNMAGELAWVPSAAARSAAQKIRTLYNYLKIT